VTAILKRFDHRAVCGLALAIAMLTGILARGARAEAATNPHLRHMRHLAHLQHVQHLHRVQDVRRLARIRPIRKHGQARAWELEIPSIGVSADLMALGDPVGPLLPVPPLAKAAVDAGWYRFTSVPGTVGNAVIVGHVDTYVGPAVFYGLYLLRRGDPIYIDLGATRERFTVSSIHELPKALFPVNQVFGGTGRHQLWLITCGGDFDYKTRHYLNNVVVSATWQPSMKPGAHEKTLAKRSGKHKDNPKHLR
jgi:sortase (surface protein transpeptidase)